MVGIPDYRCWRVEGDSIRSILDCPTKEIMECTRLVIDSKCPRGHRVIY